MSLYKLGLEQTKQIYGIRSLSNGEPITAKIVSQIKDAHINIIWISYVISEPISVAVSVIHTENSKIGVLAPMSKQEIWQIRAFGTGTHSPIILRDWEDPVYTKLQSISLVSSKGWSPTFDDVSLSMNLQIVGGCTDTTLHIRPNPQEESINKLCLSIIDSAIHIAKVAKLGKVKTKLESIPKPILVGD